MGILYCYIMGVKEASIMDVWYIFALQVSSCRSWFSLKYNIFRYINARYESLNSLYNILSGDFDETIYFEHCWKNLPEYIVPEIISPYYCIFIMCEYTKTLKCLRCI